MDPLAQARAHQSVLVVGNLNLDRILRLNAPLTRGGRIAFDEPATRRGGGGFNTARAFRALGRETAACAWVADDAPGRAWREALAAMRIDASLVETRPGRSTILELLIEPDGERTILAPSGPSSFSADLFPLPAAWPGAVYFNAGGVAPARAEALAIAPWIVAQLPLIPGRVAPADVLISSRDDAARVLGPLEDGHETWRRARAIAGPRLRELVLTDGPRPVQLIRQHGTRMIPVPQPEGPPPEDTVGAGDYFVAGWIDARLKGADETACVAAGATLALRLLREGPVLA